MLRSSAPHSSYIHVHELSSCLCLGILGRCFAMNAETITSTSLLRHSHPRRHLWAAEIFDIDPDFSNTTNCTSCRTGLTSWDYIKKKNKCARNDEITYVKWTRSFSQYDNSKQNESVGRNTFRVSKRVKWITTLNQGLYVATPDSSNLIYLKSWETKNKKRQHSLTLGHRDLCLGGTTPFCVWVNFVNPNIRQRHLLNLRWYYLSSSLFGRQGNDTWLTRRTLFPHSPVKPFSELE